MSGGAATVYQPTYWCHFCDMSITLVPSPTLLCPHCHSDSLEQMDVTTTPHHLIKSPVHSLPELRITDPTLVCPICKDPFRLNSLAKSMPCSHSYHSQCILPWLEINNSCPLCRLKLPATATAALNHTAPLGFLRLEELFDEQIELYGFRDDNDDDDGTNIRNMFS